MMYFTADPHFGHGKLIEKGFRTFSSTEEMDETMLRRINARVRRSDSLYILGDFTMGNYQATQRYRDQIVCENIYLIRGNHDHLSDFQYRELRFIPKGDIADVAVPVEGGRQRITLCHYAMRRWNKSHEGAWHLYGHSHGDLADDPTVFAFDVGMDCHDFAPLSFAEVAEKMSERAEARVHPNHSGTSYAIG